MQYLCLVYVAGAEFNAMSQSERETFQDESMANDDELQKSGQLVMAQALQPAATATTVRVRNGKLSATVGPFAETTEQLAGFVLIEARDLNDAIEVAGRIPMARIGSIEVRTEMDLQQVRDRAAR
jgi:hypothetical protein